MLCRTCFQAQATFHVLDRPSDGGLVESHYCLACYERRYVHPPTGRLAGADDLPRPADRPALPLSGFTIRQLMIVAGSFAFLNAALVLFMRSGLIMGTPAQIGERAIRAFLIVNTFFAILLVQCACLAWFREVQLRKIAGDVHLPQLKAIRGLAGLTIAWEEASPLERGLLILCLSWPFAGLFSPVVLIRPLATRYDFWLVAAALPLIMLCGEVLLLWGLVASARRR
jgi:hypothetical protein